MNVLYCFSFIFFTGPSMPTDTAFSLQVFYLSPLTDYDELDSEINKVRSELKPKVNKLRDLENKEDLKGFNLTPLSQEEKRSVESLLL